MGKSASNGHSFSNGNGMGNTHANGGPQSPATVTICGVHLGAGDNHWWKLV